jgi:hypothetical protein
MLQLALERGGFDNVTVVVVRSLPAVSRSTEPTNSFITHGPEYSRHE